MASTTYTYILDIQGKSTGIRKAAADGAKALSQYNRALQEIIQSNARWDEGSKSLRIGNVALTEVTSRAKQVAAQLNAEKQRAVKINEMLAASLSKEEIALLQNAGLMQQATGAYGSASFAVLSLTQGIQDMGQFGVGAAQGIRAINNNVQQFATALVFAAQQANGYGKALSQMGKALIGPAGVLLAFSAVSAGIEWYSNRLQKAKKDSEDAAGAFREAADSLIAFENAMDGQVFRVSEAALPEAIRKTREEIERLQAIVDDVPSDMVFQISGGALSKEAMLAQERLAKIQQERKQRAAQAEKELAAQKELLAQFEGQADLLSAQKKLAEELLALGFSLTDTSQKQTRATKEQLSTIEKLRLELDALYAAFNANGGAEREEGFLRTRIGLLEDMRSAVVDMAMADMQWRLLMTEEGVAMYQNTAALRGNNDELQRRILLRQQIIGLEQISADQLRTLSDGTVDAIERERNAIIARREAEEQAMQARINMFNRMGAELASSIAAAGGGMDEFSRMFGNFLSRWGQQLVQMGLAQMKFGAAIEAIRAAIKVPGGGFLAIAAGAALVAIGRNLRAKARAASTAGGAVGGVDSGIGPASGFVSQNPLLAGSVLTPMTPVPSQPIYVTGMFEMRGRDLVAVVESETRAQQEMGVRTGLVLSR